MVFSISSYNVAKYLQEIGLISAKNSSIEYSEIPSTSKKNFNLVVTMSENYQLLVKQERYSENQENHQEFFKEWLFHQLLQQFPDLGDISGVKPLVAHFDEENSIIVRNYLTEYIDIANFYYNSLHFPKAIAIAIGTTLGMLHSATFNHQEYRKYMATAPQGQFRYQVYNPAQGIGTMSPEIFGLIPTDAIKFYTLYQCYESLEAVIAELSTEWKPCCLTHNDLKFHNILVHSKWDKLDNCLVRFIDWEACAWGDPAFDIGTLIASYLEIWLDSLIVDPTIELEESLHLAATPLEVVQPSILALIQAYLNTFPIILEHRKNFCLQAIQFAGLVLIHQIQEMIEQRKYFSNAAICKLKVAKKLLTRPQDSMLTVFGVSELAFAKVTHKPQEETKQNLLRLYYNNTRLRGC
jgi:thiamine kinase-like enzyme